MTTLQIDIDTASTKWKGAFTRQRKKIEQAAALAYLMAKKPAALKAQDVSLTITLSTDAAMRRLNRDWRATDKPTNVLSFPQLTLPTHGRTAKTKTRTRTDLRLFAGRTLPLGDVILAFETIRRECRAQKKTLESHTLHLVVHGVLHLLGYDHMSEKEAKYMEKLECDILAMMGYPNPYHDAATLDSKKTG